MKHEYFYFQYPQCAQFDGDLNALLNEKIFVQHNILNGAQFEFGGLFKMVATILS